jgi:hypothetical protein
MRRVAALLVLLLLAGCYYPYGYPYGAYYGYPAVYPQGYAYPQAYSYPQGYYVARPAPQPRYVAPGYSAGAATDPNNCGTPDQYKPCPPAPRVPLQYYPPGKQ